MLLDAILMTLAILVALAFFARVMWVKVGVLLRAKPEARFDRIPDRIEQTIRIAFAQKKLFKEKAAGLMHALIFWGFLVLLVRSISLIGRAYDGGAFAGNWTCLWFWPALDHGYTWLKDWTELVVLAMVTYAAFRRLVLKPARLTITPSGYRILGLIATLVVTDFLYDASRFASRVPGVEAELAHAPVGAVVARWLEGASGLQALGTAMYWLHIATLLFFLNELPRSKHFHVITSIPNVFFSKLEPPGAIRPILDLENQETFGVSKPTELTWKQILDGYSCTECGRCSVNCPAHLSGKPLNPKLLICDIRDFVKKHEARILKGEEIPEGEPTLVDAVQEDVIWSCTTCRSCEENCPVTITHVDKIVDLRRYLTLMEGKVNPEVATAMKNLENKGNPWGLSSGERGAWVADLGVPFLSEKGSAEYLYFMGCFAAYDDRNQRVARAFMKLMQKAGVDFAVLGPEEQCCGDPARRLGNEYLFQMQAQAMIETFKGYGVRRVVTACPHCMNTIRHEYAQFGGDFEVLHHSEMLVRLLRDGRLEVPRDEKAERFVFHDSCYLGRYNGVYDAPREVLSACAGLDLAEVPRSRENGMCCGAGGGLMFREEKIGQRMNQVRLKQLVEAGAPEIASACPFCLIMLRDGVNELGWEERLRTQDIAEVLARRIGV